MCLVCVDWNKNKLTEKEAMSILNEMLLSNPKGKEYDHIEEVVEKILKDMEAI